MANSLTTTYPINEPYLFQAVVKIVGDGSGEITAGVVIDPANLTGTPTKFDITKIDSQINNFAVNLFWDATTPVLAAAVSQYDGLMDFKEDGQARHNDAGAGRTGKLTITTVGLTAGASGMMVITGYHR